MKFQLTKYLPETILLIIYIVCIKLLQFYYPLPHFSWDSFYYIQTSITHISSLRPIGYSYLLYILYSINHSIHFVVWAQSFLYFFSCLFFLQTLKKIFNFKTPTYLLLGTLLFTEPIALYHTNSILSDLLFSSLTLLSVSTLILYIYSSKVLQLIFHVLIVFACIETRHIALFYPVFTVITLLLFSKRTLIDYSGILLIIISFITVHRWHIRQNKKNFGVPVFSVFSGWTQTNNSLYALPRIYMDAKFIEDPQIRKMHAFFKSYMDTSTFVVHQVGSGFLWEDRSPMNVLRKQSAESLKIDFISSWYHLAPAYAEYGMFIQKNFPYEYFMSYMVPNTNTLLHPHLGEMGDYYCTQFSSYDLESLNRYHLRAGDIICRKQIYQSTLNAITDKLYNTMFWLFVIGLYFYCKGHKKTDAKAVSKSVTILALFVGAFYLVMLYSSWFMSRYILPIYPIMICLTILMSSTIIKEKIKYFSRNYSDKS